MRVSREPRTFARRNHTQTSLPGLTRQSITFAKTLLTKRMDARVKPAHDDLGKSPNLGAYGNHPTPAAREAGRSALAPSIVCASPPRIEVRSVGGIERLRTCNTPSGMPMSNG